MFRSSIAHKDGTLKDHKEKTFLILTIQETTSKERKQIILLTGTGMEKF